MIGYLQGEILEHADGKMLVGVGDRKSFGVVGYFVSIPQSAAYGAFAAGQRIELFIYSHVREEAFDLYGFNSKFEKTLFITLLSVNGIGPKSALGILSGVESTQLLDAILQGDQAFLTKVPGIGKKTAERVVVELKDSVRKKIDLGLFDGMGKSPTHSQLDKREIQSHAYGGKVESSVIKDAKDALLSLGYRDQEIHQLFGRVLENGDFRPQRAEDLIKTALRQLS